MKIGNYKSTSAYLKIITIPLFLLLLSSLSCKNNSSISDDTKHIAENLELANKALYEKFLPATVTIYAGKMNILRVKPQGAGFFFSEQYHIMTCRHLLPEKEELFAVQGKTGKIFKLKLIRADSISDCAILVPVHPKPKKLNTEYIKIKKNKLPEIGSFYIAIGAPEAFPETLMTGTVAYPLRKGGDPARPDLSFIQFCETVFPGASGSPVINIDGELIGMMRFTLTRFGRSGAGPGFAIPTEVLNRIVQNSKVMKVIDDSHMCGIIPIPLVSPYLIIKLKLPQPSGVIISTVREGSPADKAGLRRYDFITLVDDIKVKDSVSFIKILKKLKGRKSIGVRFIRNSNEKFVKLNRL